MLQIYTLHVLQAIVIITALVTEVPTCHVTVHSSNIFVKELICIRISQKGRLILMALWLC